MGILAKRLTAQTNSTIEVLDSLGVTPDDWDRVRVSSVTARRVARAFTGKDTPWKIDDAMSITPRENFFGPEEVRRILGCTIAGRGIYSNIPYSEKLLLSPCPFTLGKKICETHLLCFAGERIIDGHYHDLFTAASLNEHSGRLSGTYTLDFSSVLQGIRQDVLSAPIYRNWFLIFVGGNPIGGNFSMPPTYRGAALPELLEFLIVRDVLSGGAQRGGRYVAMTATVLNEKYKFGSNPVYIPVRWENACPPRSCQATITVGSMGGGPNTEVSAFVRTPDIEA
ncbi:MAG: hypothetical protein AAB495_01930 [Patescibacteria group bacterium]